MIKQKKLNKRSGYDSSQYEELKKLYSKSITVNYICEELLSFNINDDAISAKDFMDVNNYDFMGVEENDIIIGYINRSKLGPGQCRDYFEEFNAQNLITDSTPIIDLMKILRDITVLFILERNQVKSIVTRGDLQKPPIRMFIFGYINLLEMSLLESMHSFYKEDSWEDYIKPNRYNDAVALFNQRKARNEDIDLSDCLQLCDKAELILQKEELLELYGIESKNKGKTLFSKISRLRDKLAHSQDIVMGSSWPEIIDVVERIETLLERASQ